MHHELKIEEDYYKAVKDGSKTFEIRYNDRDYKKGDTISFKIPPMTKTFCGVYEITYMTNYEQKENYVVFGIKFLEDY